MKRAFIVALAAVCCLAAAGTAAAGVQISSLGTFSGGQPQTATQFYCGFGTPVPCSNLGLPSTSPQESQVRWGRPAGINTPSNSSGFTWLGSSGLGVSYGTPFLLGTLTHFNFPIQQGTGLSSVVLTTQLQATGDTGSLFSRNVPVTVNIEETENTVNVADCKYPSTIPCDDRISWTLPASQSVIPANGNGGPWVLSVVGFSSSATDSTTTTDGFLSQEGGTNAAYLWGSLGTVGSGDAQNDSASTIEDVVLHGDVSGNDTASGTYSVQTGPKHGTLALNPDGTFAYTPAAGYVGSDSFIYLLASGNNYSLARVDIDVQQDTTSPVITALDVTAEATGPTGATVSYASPTASDPDDAAGTVTCSPAAGSVFPLGATTVSCSSTDTHGNVGTGSFTVNVVDTTEPSITCPAGLVVEATGADGATVVPAAATASDTVSAVTIVGPTAGTYPLGTTTVAYTATDAAGNQASCATTISVVDTTAPAVTGPGDLTREATGPAGAAVTFTVTATDAVGAGAVTCDHNSGDTFPIGTTTVTCSSTDSSGNTGHASFDVTVRDTTAPTVTVPSNITVNAATTSGAAVTFTASASDIVDGTVPVTCDHASGSTFATGTTLVTCTATDAHGNTGSASFTVTVNSTAAMLNDLWLAVQGLPPGNSLPAKVKNAKAFYAAGDVADTCSMLASFISEVQAQSGKKLTIAQANDLIARARGIRTALGC